MTCPELDRLLEVMVDRTPDSDLSAHLHECPECRAYVHLLEEIPRVLEPDLVVPAALNERTIASLPQPAKQEESPRTPYLPILASGVLGLVTAFGVLVVSGSVTYGTPLEALLFSALGGGGTILVRSLTGWRAEHQEP